MASKRVVCFSCLLLLTAVSVGRAQTGGESFAPIDKIDKIFEKYDRADSPGASLGVIKDGKFVYKRNYGSANLDYGVPLESDSIFYICSTSKQFTAAAVALLAEEGKISLDDDIRKYVPEVRDFGTPITIRHLIHHTSGLADYLRVMTLEGKGFTWNFTDADLLQTVSQQAKLDFTPGEKMHYSNTGYALLTVIVKRASGMSFPEYCQAKIFGPLGMKRTFFEDDPFVIVPKRVISYRRDGEGFKAFIKAFGVVGDGGLMTSVDDLYRWDQNFYGDKIGGDKFLETIHTRGRLNDGSEIDYAFGLVHEEYRGVKAVAHGGGMLGFRTQMIRFPEHRLTIIVLCNIADANPGKLAHQVADYFLPADLPPAKTAE